MRGHPGLNRRRARGDVAVAIGRTAHEVANPLLIEARQAKIQDKRHVREAVLIDLAVAFRDIRACRYPGGGLQSHIVRPNRANENDGVTHHAGEPFGPLGERNFEDRNRLLRVLSR